MKRIVIDARISGTSTGRYIDKLVEYLHKLPLDYEIVVLTRKSRLAFMRQIAPNFTVVESNFADFSFGEQFGLSRQLYSLKPDLVHFAMVQQPVLYWRPKVTSMLDLTTLRYRNPTKNPLIFKIKQTVYYFVNWYAAKSSRHIITISDFVRRDVAKSFHVPERKITTTYNAADKITEVAEPFKPAEGKRFIMYVGRPLPHKNLSRLIDVFQLLHAEDPDLHLVLAGKLDAGYKQLQNYADHHGASNVIFTGFVSEGQLRWLYEHAAAYVFPSLSEGFGLPGLEAMQYDLPVVSSNASCLPEIYKDAVLYFDPHNTEDMADKISQVLNDKDLAKQLTSKGRALVSTYSWERMAEQTLEVFRKSLGDA